MERADYAGRPLRRALEALTGGVTWAVVISPVVGPLLIPSAWMVFLAAFSLYWLYRSLSLAAFGVVAYRRLRAAEARDWLAEARRQPGFDQLHHLVVFPTCGEPAAVLVDSLEHLARQDFPHDRIHVVLAFEARDSSAHATARELWSRFHDSFGHLWMTFHPLRPGEVPGKSANVNYAVREVQRRLVEAGVPRCSTLVTVCDADSRLHPRYLSAIACEALTAPGGRHRIYQPAILLHANLDRIPAPIRTFDCLYSLTQLARLVPSYKLVTLSTYSLGLLAAEEAGYWDVDVIPEDSHMFFKLFFRSRGSAHVCPIYLPVVVDAAEGRDWRRTSLNHYRQMRRWAWGVSDVPYVIWHALRRRSVPLGRRLFHALHYSSDHLLWPGHWFLLAVGLNLIGALAPEVARSEFGELLLGTASAALAACSPCLAVAIWLDRRLRPERSRPLWDEALFLLSWALLPLLGLGLVVLPALDAHTRLLLGRPLRYEVTEKLAAPEPAPLPISRRVPAADPQQVA